MEKNESSKEEVKSLVTQLHTRKKAKHPGGKQQTKITKFFRRQQVKSAPPSPPKKHSYSPLVPPPSLTPKVRKIAQKGAKSKIGKSSKRKSDGKLPEQKNKISDMFSLKTKKTDNSDQPVVLTLATQTWLGLATDENPDNCHPEGITRQGGESQPPDASLPQNQQNIFLATCAWARMGQ